MTFRPKTMTETIEAPADVLPHAEDSVPLEVTIKTTLTQGDRQRLTRLKGQGRSWTDVAAAYAPFVLDWTWEGEPPPA